MGVPLGGFDIDVVAADYEDWTLLTRLAYDYGGDYYGVPTESLAELTRYLLRFGADPDLTSDSYNYTALAMAADYQATDEDFVDMLEAYVAAGADMNIPDVDGRTALTWRARGHDSETLKPMLNFGADPDARDVDGNTPYEDASNEDETAVLLDSMYTGVDAAI